MSFIVLEGIDRSGKSTVAEYYRKQGYKIIHFTAPNKKYSEPGYAGPSYVDEILEIYMNCDGQDVVFDRSIYGELIWPHVYGRSPQLDEEDIDMFREFEDRNEVKRILMIDPDKDAHWRRCVDNNEPLNANQFKLANRLYERLAHEYDFIPRTLGDYIEQEIEDRSVDSKVEDTKPEPNGQVKDSPVDLPTPSKPVLEETKTTLPERQEKLEKANAINQLLSKRIIRHKGEIYDSLEKDIRSFLDHKLNEIFGTGDEDGHSFTEQEVEILKIFCQRLNEKQKGEKIV